MAKKVFHKRSSVLGQMPTGDTLSHGEIAVNFNSAEPFLSIKDSEGKYIKFSSDEAYLQGDKVLSDKYDELYTLVDENEQVAAHALTNLDERVKEIEESSDDYIAADEAVLENAKTYVDSKAKEIENAYVLADNAILVDAKEYTDEKIAALPETYTKTEVDNLLDGVQEGLINEVKAREDAVTELTNAIIENELVVSNSLNDLNTRVNGIKEGFDNLDFTAVVEETKTYTDTQIKQVENAYKAADNTVLDTAKTYTDNQITALGELYTKNEVNDLLTNVQNNVNDSVLNHAKDTNLHVTTELQTKWNTAATEAAKVSELVTTVGEHTTKLGTIETNVSKNAQDILNEAKAREDAVTELANVVYENEEIVANSLNDLNIRINNLEDFNGDIDFSSVIEEANEYTDSKAKEIENAYKAADNVILTSGKTYTDEKIAALPKTYTKTEVDNLLSSTKNELNASIKEQEDALTDLTNEIIDNEEVVSSALTDLDARLIEVEEHLESNVMIEAAVAEAASYTDAKVKSVEDAYPVAVAAAQTTAIETSTGYTQTYSAPKSHTHGTIALTGNATGSADFTNTGASIAVTVKNDSHTHTTSTISDTIDTKSGITSGATGLVQGKAVYEYAQPKGNYQAAGSYAVADHTHGLKLDGDVTGSVTLNNDTVTITTTVADNSHSHTSSNISDRITEGASITSGATGVVTGKAVYEYSAPKLHSHGTISLTGDATGSASFGNGGATIAVTVDGGKHEHVSSAVTDAISNANGITSSATGLVQGKAIYEYAQPKGNYQVAGSYAAADHTHGLKLDGDVTGSVTLNNGTVTMTTTVADNSHSHTASNITAGVFDIARIPTGTTTTTVALGKHTHVKSEITDFAHTHKVSEISDFSTEVDNKINAKLAANDAMLFKGTITSASLPTTFQAGWTYKVATAGTYYGINFEVGDMIIAIADGSSVTTSSSNFATYWTAVQTNVDGHVSGPSSSVADRIAVFDGTSGKLIKDGGLTISGLAKASHEHAASDITSGTLNIARIPTGTTSTTVARGDHSHNYAASSHSHGTITLTGDVTGSASFGNGGATITTTVADNSHSHTSSNISDRITTGTSITSGATGVTTGKAVYEYAQPKGNYQAAGSYAASSHSHGTISLTGDVTGSASFTNTGASITATVANNSHYHVGGDITGGTIPITVLPTGTTSTTVSRGDHTHSYITWVDGMNTATSLTNIPITKRMCKVTVSASATLTVTSGLAAGRELHVLIYNSGSSAITVTMPTSGYVNFGEEAITIPSKLYAEVNILSDGTTYFIRNGQ